jgi:glycerol uptake facilitator-like aquaporin
MSHRPLFACCLAEFLGTFLLVLLGCGAVHSAVLMDGLSGLWQIGIVWGIAIMLAIYVCGPISGAHINPAITLGFAVWRMFPWQRVGPYMASQLAGAFIAALVLFSVFHAGERRDRDVLWGIFSQPRTAGRGRRAADPVAARRALAAAQRARRLPGGDFGHGGPGAGGSRGHGTEK